MNDLFFTGCSISYPDVPATNKKLNDRCVLFVDVIMNADEKDRTREEKRTIIPEVSVNGERFAAPCCEHLLEYVDKFKEVYDGHLGLEFVTEGDEYFEDFTNCPFCGADISYSVRKTFEMVSAEKGNKWVKREVTVFEY
jgi:hypothetical protein